MSGQPYRALIDDTDAEVFCACDDCSWKGQYSELHEIEECILTPGDPSPAGRCPRCDTLAYVVKPG